MRCVALSLPASHPLLPLCSGYRDCEAPHARKLMAPFPSSVRSRSSGGASLSSGGLLPLHSPSASSSAAAAGAGPGMHAYPPASSPRSTSPVEQQQGAAAAGMGAGETPQQRLQRLDPRRLFGAIKAPNHGGILKGGLGGITHESTETVRRCLEVSPSLRPSAPYTVSREEAWRRIIFMRANLTPDGVCAYRRTTSSTCPADKPPTDLTNSRPPCVCVCLQFSHFLQRQGLPQPLLAPP